jgi:tight adherence protein B
MHLVSAQVYFWVALACGIGSIAAVVFVLARTRHGVALAAYGRYLAYLTRRLRRLHVFEPAARIANAQLVIGFIVLAGAAFGVLPYWYLFLVVVGGLPALLIEKRTRERIARLDRQADAFCLALANALKSTASVGAAVDPAAALMDGPVHEEVQLAVKETRLGRSLAEALEAVGPRAGSRKLAIVIGAVLVGRQVGGNLPKVLDTTANTLREMERLEGVVRQKTAEGRMQLWALSLAPLLICAAIHKLDPTYFEPLTTRTIGYVATAVAIALYIGGLILARKVLAVDI